MPRWTGKMSDDEAMIHAIEVKWNETGYIGPDDTEWLMRRVRELEALLEEERLGEDL